MPPKQQADTEGRLNSPDGQSVDVDLVKALEGMVQATAQEHDPEVTAAASKPDDQAVASENSEEANPDKPADAEEPITGESDDQALSAGDSEGDETPEAKAKREGESRRAAKERERQEERERERREWQAQWEREKKAKEEADERLRVYQAAQQKRQEEARSKIGPEDEFQRRMKMSAKGELSYQEREELDKWIEAREVADIFHEDARLKVLNSLAQQASRVAHLPGIDPTIVRDEPAFDRLCLYFYEQGKALGGSQNDRPDAAIQGQLTEAQTRLAELEAENENLRRRQLGSGRNPEVGGTPGRPVPTRIRQVSWSDSADKMFRDALTPAK